MPQTTRWVHFYDMDNAFEANLYWSLIQGDLAIKYKMPREAK